MLTDTEVFNLIKEYSLNNNFLRIIIAAIPFVVPCALCTIYAKNHNCHDVQQEKKLLVNTPLVFSLIGISGWTTGLAINIILIFYLKLKIGISVLSIILDYTFSITFCLQMFEYVVFVLMPLRAPSFPERALIMSEGASTATLIILTLLFS